MRARPYCMYPCIHENHVVFVTESDLFYLDLSSRNVFRRLSTCGDCETPMISQDGRIVVFQCRLSGEPEVFAMPLEGGVPKQLTWLGSGTTPVGFNDSCHSNRLFVRSWVSRGIDDEAGLFHVDLKFDMMQDPDFVFQTFNDTEFGVADYIYAGRDVTVLGRYSVDPHVSRNWKHYKGGARGQLWISGADGKFERICEDLNVGGIQFLEDTKTIFFVADPDSNAPGNLFSVCLNDRQEGANFKPEKLTYHEDFYVRNPSLCPRSKRIIYQCGGDLYLFDIETKKTEAIEMNGFPGFAQTLFPRIDGNPTYELVDSVTIHPDGLYVCVTVRGRLFEMPLWEGPCISLGVADGRVRYSCQVYLRDGRIAAIACDDDPSSIKFEIFPGDGLKCVVNETKTAKQKENEDVDGTQKEQGSGRVTFDIDLQTFGIPTVMIAAPKRDFVCFVNNRFHLILFNYATGNMRIVDHAKFDFGICDLSFSNCGTFIVYSFQTSHETSVIRTLDVRNGEKRDITKNDSYYDFSPVFDEEGRYCYLLSANRNVICVEDQVWRSTGFISSHNLLLVTLDGETPTPFIRSAAPPTGVKDQDADGDDEEEEEEEGDDVDDEGEITEPGEGEEEEEADGDDDNDGEDDHTLDEDSSSSKGQRGQQTGESTTTKLGKKKKSDGKGGMTASSTAAIDAATEEEDDQSSLKIDFKRIGQRLFEFPFQVKPGYRVHSLTAISGNRVLFIRTKVLGKKNPDTHIYNSDQDSTDSGDLICFDLEKRSQTVLRSGDVLSIQKSLSGNTLMIETEDYYSCYSANVDNTSGEFADDSSEDEWEAYEDRIPPTRNKGKLELLSRITIQVKSQNEWPQMLAEVWRASKEESHHRLSTDTTYDKFQNLLPRVRARVEFTDILQECLSEFSVSHSEQYGGDYNVLGRGSVNWDLGFIGADTEWTNQGARITNLVQGVQWSCITAGPLANLDRYLKIGNSTITRVNGRALTNQYRLAQALRGLSYKEVLLHITTKGVERAFRVKCVDEEAMQYMRYVDSVQEATDTVHRLSGNKVGYIHIPSMDTKGFTRFSKAFRKEKRHDAVIIDVRGNRGGNLSEMLLEKISKRCVAVELPKWGRMYPFPTNIPSTTQILVLLVNERSCSDAEIFADSFRSLNLGPVVGVTTWGGTIGVSSHTVLVDGTQITHPNMAYYSLTNGFCIENQGVRPDVNIPVPPRSKGDVQLEAAVEIAKNLLREYESKGQNKSFKQLSRKASQERPLK